MTSIPSVSNSNRLDYSALASDWAHTYPSEKFENAPMPTAPLTRFDPAWRFAPTKVHPKPPSGHIYPTGVCSSGMMYMTPAFVGLFHLSPTSTWAQEQQPIFALGDMAARMASFQFELCMVQTVLRFSMSIVLDAIAIQRLNARSLGSGFCAYDMKGPTALVYAALVHESGRHLGAKAYAALARCPWTLTVYAPSSSVEILSDWQPAEPKEHFYSGRGFEPVCFGAYIPFPEAKLFPQS